MKQKTYGIHCGFSANPEIHQTIGRSSNDKEPILEEKLYLSGSTVNTANALRNMGFNCNPFILTAVQDGLLNNSDNKLLVDLLFDEDFPRNHFSILDQPNKATVKKYLDGSKQRLESKKGKVISKLIPEAISEMEEIIEKVTWAVCTGLQLSEKDLGIALFQKAEQGKRFLVPKPELVLDEDAFHSILKHTDIVQMNDVEFLNYASNSPNVLLSKGPKILIITKDKEGGDVFLKNKKHFSYEAFSLDKEPLSFVGAGDWFTGAFVSFMEENGLDANSNDSLIRDAANFAAQVSAKKLLFEGGSNGPQRSEII